MATRKMRMLHRTDTSSVDMEPSPMYWPRGWVHDSVTPGDTIWWQQGNKVLFLHLNNCSREPNIKDNTVTRKVEGENVQCSITDQIEEFQQQWLQQIFMVSILCQVLLKILHILFCFILSSQQFYEVKIKWLKSTKSKYRICDCWKSKSNTNVEVVEINIYCLLCTTHWAKYFTFCPMM